MDDLHKYSDYSCEPDKILECATNIFNEIGGTLHLETPYSKLLEKLNLDPKLIGIVPRDSLKRMDTFSRALLSKQISEDTFNNGLTTGDVVADVLSIKDELDQGL